MSILDNEDQLIEHTGISERLEYLENIVKNIPQQIEEHKVIIDKLTTENEQLKYQLSKADMDHYILIKKYIEDISSLNWNIFTLISQLKNIYFDNKEFESEIYDINKRLNSQMDMLHNFEKIALGKHSNLTDIRLQ